MKTLKVVHLNTSGVGGAAIACHRLHKLMLEAGVKSDVVHQYRNCKEEKGYHFIDYSSVRRISNHLLFSFVQADLKPDAYVFNEMAPLPSHIARHPRVQEADVIYLHWVQGGFFSYKDFIEVANLGKPVFCFTHDEWWITGGCHYAFDCDRYKTGCKGCQLHKYMRFLPCSQAEKKRKLYKHFPNFQLISPSAWLQKCADDSYVLGRGRCSHIPNVVPDKVFVYRDKDEARMILGLPQDKIIVSFGTADNSNKVKGVNYLIEALKKIENDQLLLCVYGSDYDEELVAQVKQPVRFLGKLTDEHQVALANAASDLFVSPTLAESFGLTLMENIKCGTPVISTKVTAVPEVVKEGVSGYLVEPHNSDQIVAAINSFIANPLRIDGKTAEIFSDRYILESHLSLIRDALSKCDK